MNSKELAQRFSAAHRAGTPLVLYNIWDAGSAQAVAEAGVVALATGSASVAMAQGYDDGEQLPLAALEQTVRQICAASSLPVSVDMESGYARSPQGVAATALRLAKAGAIGCNFEDQIIGEEDLYDTAAQCQRIGAIRTALAAEGLTMHINARTDVFLKSPDDAQHATLLGVAIERAQAYIAAGADSVFLPWLRDSELIRTACQRISAPVNIMHRDGIASISELGKLGVARVSFGPAPYRETMRRLQAAAATWLTGENR